MSIIIKPLITEKMTLVTEKSQRYGFIVDKKANKIEIKKAIDNLYKVNVEEINTMINPGKSKSRNTKSGFIKGSTSAYKKAIVSLASGETIDFYSNI
jgi:large subunit ribosomal protein L23